MVISVPATVLAKAQLEIGEHGIALVESIEDGMLSARVITKLPEPSAEKVTAFRKECVYVAGVITRARATRGDYGKRKIADAFDEKAAATAATFGAPAQKRARTQ